MTERTAADTERPGEGNTPAEMGQQAFCAAMERGEPLAHAWQFAAVAIQATIIPCTFPFCLSAQTAAKAGEEIARLKGDIAALKAELSNLIAATKGQTFFHSDEAVNAEMGRLRGELAASEKCCSDCEEKQMGVNAAAYQRGVEEERERCAQLLLGQGYQFEPIGIGALRIKWAKAIRTSSPAPQKNTAECQDVCRWDMEDHSELRGLYQTDCGYALEDKLPEYFDKTVCPRCGKPIKVGNG